MQIFIFGYFLRQALLLERRLGWQIKGILTVIKDTPARLFVLTTLARG